MRRDDSQGRYGKRKGSARPGRSGRSGSKLRWKDWQKRDGSVHDRGAAMTWREEKTPSHKHPTTVFIDNIDRDISEYHLGRIIRKFVNWTRLYISRKVRRFNRNSFAFVDVAHIYDAKRLIEGIRGWNINGSKLWARMEFQGYKEHANKIQRAGPYYHQSKTNDMFHQRSKGASSRSEEEVGDRKERVHAMTRLSISVKSDKVMKAGLNRCVVISLQEEMSPSEAVDCLQRRWSNLGGLLALSRRKYLLIFNTTKEVEVVLDQAREKGKEQDGIEIRRWNTADQVERRCTWVVIRGIPLHAWNKNNVRKIAQTVGEVVKIEEEEDQFVENAEIRVQIDTSTLHTINWKIMVKVDNQKFPVSIVEAYEQMSQSKKIDRSESIIQIPEVHNKKTLGQQSSNVDQFQNVLEGEDETNRLAKGDSGAENSEDASVHECSYACGADSTGITPQHVQLGTETVAETQQEGGTLEKAVEKRPSENEQDSANRQKPCDQGSESDDKNMGASAPLTAQIRQQNEDNEEIPFQFHDSLFQDSPRQVLVRRSRTEDADGDTVVGTQENKKSVEDTQHCYSEEEIIIQETPPRMEIPARNENGKIINPEAEADECIKLLLQLGCQVPNPIQTKANIVSQIQDQWM